MLVDVDLSVKCSGGFIVQVMPEAMDSDIDRLEQNLANIKSVTTLMNDGKTPEDMLATVHHIVKGGVHGIKLQLLHILEDTDLADYYRTAPASEFACMSMDSYFDVLTKILPLIPDDTVIYRLTGDGPKRTLLAPLWSADKKKVLNILHAQLERSFPCNPKC